MQQRSTNMSRKIKNAVIFAGGLGTRLKPWTENNQKAMYPINGRPFLLYLIDQIKDFGIDDIYLLLGYKAYTVIDYFTAHKSYVIWENDISKCGVEVCHTSYNDLKIKFIITPVDYDTNLRLKSAKDYIDSDFLMMYCDNICPIDFDKLVDNFYKHNAMIELSVYENKDNWTKSNIIIDNGACDGRVLIYDKKRLEKNLNGVDIGCAILSKKIFDIMSDDDRDMEMAKVAGVRGIKVDDDYKLIDAVNDLIMDKR